MKNECNVVTLHGYSLGGTDQPQQAVSNHLIIILNQDRKSVRWGKFLTYLVDPEKPGIERGMNEFSSG